MKVSKLKFDKILTLFNVHISLLKKRQWQDIPTLKSGSSEAKTNNDLLQCSAATKMISFLLEISFELNFG